MNIKFCILQGLLILGMVACSDDGSSDASSANAVQDLKYEGKKRVLEIDPGVGEVHLSGIKNKQVIFARANVKDQDGVTDYSIKPEDQSYIKMAIKRRSLAIDRKISVASSAIEIPKTKLKQLTKSDLEVGKTKRVFNVVNNRYYDENDSLVKNPDKNYKNDGWIELEFTPCAVGDNIIVWKPTSDIDPKTGKVWSFVYDSKEYKAEATEKVKLEMCETIKDKFEAILPYETALFGEKSKQIFSVGYSHSSVPSKPVDITMYSDLANFTNLLIYDFTAVSGRAIGVGGYFDAADYWPSYKHFDYSSDMLVAGRSNEGNFLYFSVISLVHPEIFVFSPVDEKTNVPYNVYSSLAHEYMHSLQYARKNIEQNAESSDVYFGELLGVLCEYVMAPKLDIPANVDIVRRRFLPYRYDYTDVGLAESRDGDPKMYEAAFAFGAFLLHNYGGQKILSKMLRNQDDGNDAIVNAVKQVAGEDLSMEDLFKNFMEAMVCRGSKYAENMNKSITMQADGVKFTREGINVFDLTDHGYVSAEDYAELSDQSKYDVYSFALLNPAGIQRIGLREGFGFHLFDVDVKDGADTTTIFLDNDGDRSKYEKLYILVSDKDQDI